MCIRDSREPVPPGTAQAATIDPALDAVLAHLGPRDNVPVIVILRDQVDPRTIGPHRGERRGAALVRMLKVQATATQGPVRALIGQGRDQGEAAAATPRGIINGVAVTARASLIRRLARRPEVASIVPDRSIAARGTGRKNWWQSSPGK